MKIARHEEILKIISLYDVETQDELAARLNENGFPATQATVSRDIKELKLSKVVSENGSMRYSLPGKVKTSEGKYLRAFKEALVSMDAAGNFLVIKTESGMAMAAAAALDELDWDDIAGCIAGDNTIFVATKSAGEAISVLTRLKKIIG